MMQAIDLSKRIGESAETMLLKKPVRDVRDRNIKYSSEYLSKVLRKAE